jgi:hypothetical protein
MASGSMSAARGFALRYAGVKVEQAKGMGREITIQNCKPGSRALKGICRSRILSCSTSSLFIYMRASGREKGRGPRANPVNDWRSSIINHRSCIIQHRGIIHHHGCDTTALISCQRLSELQNDSEEGLRTKCQSGSYTLAFTCKFASVRYRFNQAGSKCHRLTQAARKPAMSADPCRPRQRASHACNHVRPPGGRLSAAPKGRQ